MMGVLRFAGSSTGVLGELTHMKIASRTTVTSPATWALQPDFQHHSMLDPTTYSSTDDPMNTYTHRRRVLAHVGLETLFGHSGGLFSPPCVCEAIVSSPSHMVTCISVIPWMVTMAGGPQVRRVGIGNAPCHRGASFRYRVGTSTSTLTLTK